MRFGKSPGLVLICFFMIALSSSGRAEPQDKAIQPPDWKANLRLPEAADINPDPNIVEVNLEARVADVEVGGRHIQAWTYNGSVPGPLIRANVGDRVVVHFT